jgi:uncharacterized protein (TIGR01244 family)
MFEQIYNFMAVSDTLFTGGMPTADQLDSAAQKGVQVVINLAPHNTQDALPDEEEFVNLLGMQYIHIPVNWNSPSRDDLDKFMDALDSCRETKVLVHCEANFRASAFVAMYRILRQGWKTGAAMGVMHKIWNEDAYPAWNMFIKDMLNRSRNNKTQLYL